MTKGDKERLRAEISGKIAAAIVSTIHNDQDYLRIWHLGNNIGMTVSQWIAHDSVKQADALVAELEKEG